MLSNPTQMTTSGITYHEALEVGQWSDGEHLMFAEFVAPWGHSRHILNNLRGKVFPKYRAFSLGRNPDGSIRKIYYWKGTQFKERIAEEQRSINQTLWTQPGSQ